MARGARTYVCDFGRGVKCTMRVPSSLLEGLKEGGRRMEAIFEWEGTPSPKIIPKYKKWVLSVYRELSDELGARMMYVFTEGGSYEAWGCEPGKPPVLLLRG